MQIKSGGLGHELLSILPHNVCQNTKYSRPRLGDKHSLRSSCIPPPSFKSPCKQSNLLAHRPRCQTHCGRWRTCLQIIFLTENFRRPPLTIFVFATQNKNIAATFESSRKQSNLLAHRPRCQTHCGRWRTRTSDPSHVKRMLYQLS